MFSSAFVFLLLLFGVQPKPMERKRSIQITGQNAVLEGQTISLQCDATGDDLDWFKDGQRLDWWIREAAGISIRMIPSTDTISSILQVESARARDAGIYVCRSSSLEITSVRVSVWHAPTTTTTTTTTTPWPAQPETGPVQSEQHSCGRAWMCMQPLQSTLQLIGSADFATLADSIDDVCSNTVPEAERCMVSAASLNCGIGLTIMHGLCADREALKAGRRCWGAGYQNQATTCQQQFFQLGPTIGTCRAVELLGTCIGNWMSSTPECTPSDGQVLQNLIDNNTAQLCQNDSL